MAAVKTARARRESCEVLGKEKVLWWKKTARVSAWICLFSSRRGALELGGMGSGEEGEGKGKEGKEGKGLGWGRQMGMRWERARRRR